MDKLVKKIVDQTNLTEKEIWEKVRSKQEELSNLISEQGAIHIVARELEVNLGKEKQSISELKPGKGSTKITAKVRHIGDITDFSTDKGKGKVGNIFLADKTGSIRMSLWNEETEYLKKLHKGDVVEAIGYTKEDNQGNPELRLGKYGKLKKVDKDIDLHTSPKRTHIKNLVPGQSGEIRAALLQIFGSKPFYEVCEKCKKSASKCEHNAGTEKKMLLTGIVDDGTGSIRFVSFDSQAQKILGTDKEKTIRLFDQGGMNKVTKNVHMGKEFIITGRAQKNKYTDRPEMMIDNVKNVNIQHEIERCSNARSTTPP